MIATLRRCARSKDGLAAVEFALISPMLLMLVFSVIIYSLYFATVLGVRQATAEGARYAMAGLSTTERQTLATSQINTVMAPYLSLMGANSTPQISFPNQSAGLFEVKVSYNVSASPLLTMARFLPMPSNTITSDIIVANGSY